MPLSDPLPDAAEVDSVRPVAHVDLASLLGLEDHDDPRPRIAIVGAGPTGLYTLLHLTRGARRPLHIDLFEKGPVAGPGMPYAEASGTPALLANIAGRELPPVTETLHGWLNAQSPEVLQEIGIATPEISALAFVPRVAIGAYFTAQCAKLVAQARARGHTVELHRYHRVRDVVPATGCVTLLWDAPYGEGQASYDDAIIATGHQWRDTVLDGGVTALSPWPAERLGRLPADRICILGSALSALDAAVAIACARGSFVEDGKTLRYRATPGRERFHITLASRKGLLPEADFWYDLPLPEVPRLAAVTPGPALFARAFDALLLDLAEADPACAARLGGASATPEGLASAWFAPRLAADPFDWAEHNLTAAETGYGSRRAEPWRSVFLRAHEVFEALLPYFPEGDLDRFHATLRPVFADNYACVPHLSIRRLLALHAAGHLDIIALGREGKIAAVAGGLIELQAENGTTPQAFDVLVDARGQAALRFDDLGFPSLSAALPFWNKARFDRYDFPLPSGGRVHMLALPVLLHRRPFVQGLVNADDMGRDTAARILLSLDQGTVAR